VRALWFSPVEPGPVRRKANMPPALEGSWVDNLLMAIAGKSNMTIAVASAGEYPYESLEVDGVTYFHLPRETLPAGRVRRVTRNWARCVKPSELLAPAQELVSRVKPDVAHVFGTENPFGLLASRTSVPCLVSLQGLTMACADAYFRGVAPSELVRLALSREFLRGASEIHGYLRMRLLARQELEVLRTATHFAGRTDWDRSIVSAFNPNAHYHHLDEILRPLFYTKKWEGRAGPPVVFSTSSPMLFKGTEVLLKALSILSQTGIRLRLRVAGVPDEGQVSRFYRRVACREGVEGQVTWLGRVDAERLADELCTCSLFVHPSHVDNSPNSLAEAMLLGVPCIASNAGGIPSLLRHGKHGLLFPDGDAAALAGSIRSMVHEPAVAAELGAAARKRALARHDPETVANGLLDIYSAVLT